jgi:hypothetical protein
MPSIVSYRKASDAYSTFTLATPEGATELCTLDDVTYVSLPDGAVLPQQPAQIAASVATITLTPALRTAIAKASPHCQLIDARMRDNIRASYDLETELKYARFGVGKSLGLYTPTPAEIQEIGNFGAFVEGVRQWGVAERAKLGL